MTTTVQALTKARKLINDGWVQGEYNWNDEEFCAMGSIYHALGISADGSPNDLRVLGGKPTAYLANAIVLEGFRKKVGKSFADQASSVIGFNDDEKTTKAMVLQAFGRAIRNAKRRHIHG